MSPVVICAGLAAVALGAAAGRMKLVRGRTGRSSAEWEQAEPLGGSYAWVIGIAVAVAVSLGLRGGFGLPPVARVVLVGLPGGFCLPFLLHGLRLRRRDAARRRAKPGLWLTGGVGLAGALVFALELGPYAAQLAGAGLMLLAIAILLVAAVHGGVIDGGRGGDLARRLLALDPRVLAATTAGAVALLAMGSGVEACCYPEGSLRASLAERLGPGQASALPFGGGPAWEIRRPGSPTAVAREVELAWPSEDQRYTPVGILLRYEREIVAVLPATRGSSRVLVAEDARAFRVFADQIGDFWGASYDRRGSLPRSARATPDRRDERRLAAVLDAAERDQARPLGAEDRPCYSWAVEIRSGDRAGRRVGSAGGPGRARRQGCSVRFALEGFIDPNAGRLQRGPRGDYALGVACFCERLPSNEQLDTPPNEILEGSTQQPSAGGVRPGKGMIEHIEALPLLAAEAGDVPFVQLTAPRARPASALSPTEMSDRERRADSDGWAGVGAALLRVAGGFLLTGVVLLVAGGLVLRVRRQLNRPR